MTTLATDVDGCHSACHPGHAADHLAFESMTTPKDVISALGVIGNRQADTAASIERHIENSREGVSGLITDASFRSLEQFKDAAIQATLNAKDGIIDSAKNAAALGVQAEKLAAAAALAAQECCCETKALILAESCQTRERIREDGEKTRDLINAIEKDRQAVALVDCKVELSNARQDERFRALLAAALAGNGPGNSAR